MNPLLIGLIGSSTLMAGWVYETCKALKKRRELIDLGFAGFYLVGLSLLGTYSFIVHDKVYICLNLILLTLVAIEAGYTIYLHKRKRLRK